MSATTQQLIMPVSRQCSIPSISRTNPLDLIVTTGTSIIIIGANGSGKTRLGAHLERELPPQAVQRIPAQKSLRLSSNIDLISYERAEKALRYGYPDGVEATRLSNRWGGNPAVSFLNDFDALQQTLFAERNRVAVKHLDDRKTDINSSIPTTKLGHLKELWDSLLPHRNLEIGDATINVMPVSHSQGLSSAQAYSGSEMSDGERAIFYFLGQCLVAPKDGVIIIDEPDPHVHKAILGRLWDAAEAARPDCAFVYMTHDLDFASGHAASTKYFIKAFESGGIGRWDIEPLPDDTGLPDHVVTELVGSRRPILFIEGEKVSLDLTIYGSVYRDFTVVPIGSCDHVIHSVRSYKNSRTLHGLGAVRGLIDADDRNAQEITHLRGQDIYVLSVAEIENQLAMPPVFLALAKVLLCSDPTSRLALLQNDIISNAQSAIDLICSRYTIRRLDRKLKRVSVAAHDLATLNSKFSQELAGLDPTSIFQDVKAKLDAAIHAQDLPGVLALYDIKGFVLSRVATRLGLAKANELQEKLTRMLGEKESHVRDALTAALPTIPV